MATSTTADFFTTGQAAIEIGHGATERRLGDLIRRGKLPRPARKVNGRWAWSRREIDSARPVVQRNG